MKSYILYITLLFSLILGSCRNDSKQREAENLKAMQKKDSTFNAINKSWKFNNTPFSPQTQAAIDGWSEWRLFQTELQQKPKSTIGAFQQKTKTLALKATALTNNIPPIFDKPQVKSRIMAMITKVKVLETYILLNNIPDQKVVTTIGEINLEIQSIQDQMEEIVRRKNTQLEEGEAAMLQSLDTLKQKLPEGVKPAPVQNLPSGHAVEK
ncbi:hypothetical protein [Flavobacterium sp. '19STA2R22 D10 B1']|uniref:hypothetical protein n=1 Tax=Flavobacterium aerium TaxID=3037261 RepID=UPI00278C204E|nr:hypothetical protein [Flavobacterium sp. '19STA2R22 D10 B1']